MISYTEEGQLKRLKPALSTNSIESVASQSSSSSLKPQMSLNMIHFNQDDSVNHSATQSEEVCSCAFCENTATLKCSHCGIPLCRGCYIEELDACQYCASEIIREEAESIDRNENRRPSNTDEEAIPASRRLSTF